MIINLYLIIMALIMTSPTFSFDESKFICKFASDYYTENCDLDVCFREYFQNFIDSNSYEYNLYVYNRLRIKFRARQDLVQISIRDYLYNKLHEIIKKGINA